MFNDKTKEKIEELEKLELEVAEKWGVVFNSYHEAWAVLKEEIEEAEADLESAKKVMEYLWTEIKMPGTIPSMSEEKTNEEIRVEEIKNFAFTAIEELAQVLAVCEKFDRTITMINDNRQGERNE